MKDTGLNSNFFDKFKNNLKPIIVALFGAGSAEHHRGKIQKRATSRNIRREVRRKELRTEVQSVERDPSLTSSQKEEKKEIAMLEHTLSSLDDNQSSDNVLQDLRLAKALPTGTRTVILEVQEDVYLPRVPTSIVPAKGRAFTLHIKNGEGVVRTINNPLTSLALPVENQSSTTKEVGGAGPSEPFASITFASSSLRADNGKEISITTLDLETNEIQTITTNKNQTEVEEFFQGINPNSVPMKVEPRPAMTTSAVTTLLLLLQVAVMYFFLTPFLKYFQTFFKKKVLNRIFKNDFKNSNEKNQGDEDESF